MATVTVRGNVPIYVILSVNQHRELLGVLLACEEFLKMVGPDHVMGLAIGNELESLLGVGGFKFGFQIYLKPKSM